MGDELQGIGLMIGDTAAIAVGFGESGPCWEVRQPARVCAPSPADPVELLLAGDEAVAAGMAPLLASPRRRGYAPGAPAVATELLAALLATLRQKVPPAHLERPSRPPVLALSHTLGGRQADLVKMAAFRAGWGEARVVSELAALAALQAPSHAGDTVSVTVVDGGSVHNGQFRVRKGSGLLLVWEHAKSVRIAGTAGPSPEEEADLARGAARLSLGLPFAGVAIADHLPVELGLSRPNGTAAMLLGATGPGRVVRAICPPPPDGVLLELVACMGGRPLQPVAAIPLEPTGAPASGSAPWILTLTVSAPLQGSLRVETADGLSVAEQPFSIRLP